MINVICCKVNAYWLNSGWKQVKITLIPKMQVCRFFGEVYHLSAIPSNHVIWMDRNISQGELLFVSDHFWWLTDLFWITRLETKSKFIWTSPCTHLNSSNQLWYQPWTGSQGIFLSGFDGMWRKWGESMSLVLFIFFETFSYFVNNLSSMPLFVVFVLLTSLYNTNTTYSINLKGRVHKNTSQ